MRPTDGLFENVENEMTPQEKRYLDLGNTISRTLAQREACLANMVRYELRLKDLRRKRDRLAKAMAKPKPFNAKADLVQQVTAAIGHPPVEAVTDIPFSEFPIAERLDEDEPIPAFLKRAPAPKKTDAELGAELKAAIEEKRKAKARGRIAKMKAKQAGDLKKMPLTGRAALEAIRNG